MLTKLQNDSESNEEEILRERFMPPELRNRIVADLRLKEKKTLMI